MRQAKGPFSANKKVAERNPEHIKQEGLT